MLLWGMYEYPRAVYGYLISTEVLRTKENDMNEELFTGLVTLGPDTFLVKVTRGHGVEPGDRRAGHRKDRVFVWATDAEGKDLTLAAEKNLLSDLDLLGRFSAKAGCSCGCSPGFVRETRTNWDTFVHATQVS